MTAVLFDISRLFLRASLSSPTGIDRVTMAYGRWLLARPDVQLRPVCSWGGRLWPVARDACERLVRRRPAADAPASETWRRLAGALKAPASDQPTLRAPPTPGRLRAVIDRYGPALAKTVANLRPAGSRAGELYLNVSHFGLEQPGVLDRLAAHGVRAAAMVHDLIPIAHPEFCSPFSSRMHVRRIDALLERGALVIANSRTTAEELTDYARATGRRTPEICIAPLGLESAFLRPASGPQLEETKPYFVCVGTLEPRKNVTFLLTLWRRLAEEMGEATPPLVLIGQRGWENESIIDHLERSPPILRFVHEAHDLGDAELACLLSGAAALLAPSFTEGFDLPVSEALALGAPVIASDIPVHREFAGQALLVDPLDGPAWLAAIRAAAHESRPRSPGRAPTWDEHFAIVSRALGLGEAPPCR